MHLDVAWLDIFVPDALPVQELKRPSQTTKEGTQLSIPGCIGTR
jgi:hypothetical protein